MVKPLRYPFLVMAVIFLAGSTAHAFSFSRYQKQEETAEAEKKSDDARQNREMLSVPCRNSLKKKKIAVMVGELFSDGGFSAMPAGCGPLFQEINSRLRNLGLRTCTREEITAQIAQAEMEAFLSNDLEAAAGAADRLKADFILKGLIRTHAQANPVTGINEVFLNMTFTLVNAAGRVISEATADSDSYAGADAMPVAMDLVRDKADGVVARLYHDYCAGARP